MTMTSEERENKKKRDKQENLEEGLDAAAKIKELIIKDADGDIQLREDHNAFVSHLLKEARALYEK